MIEFFEDHPIFSMLAILGLLFLAAILFPEFMARRACNNYERVTDRPTRYVAFDTCYVQRDAQWYRWDEYKLAFATEGKIE